MKNKVLNFLNSFSSGVHNPDSIRLFRYAIYLWVLIHTLLLLPEAGRFWGENSYNVPSHLFESSEGIFRVLFLLNIPGISPFYPLFCIGLCVFIVMSFTGRLRTLSSIMIYILAINLDHKANFAANGGNNLIHILLIYLIFMNEDLSTKNKDSFLVYFSNALTNCSFFMVKIQICILYFVAAVGKIHGDLWSSGVAMYYVAQVDIFSLQIMKTLMTNSPFLVTFSSYATVAFQLSFPYLVWFKNTRPFILAFGTVLHLSISLVVGLFFFGLALVFSYTAFYENKTAYKRLQFFLKGKNFLISKIRSGFKIT